MPQVKKQGMREAIVEAAFQLFSHRGYNTTTMVEIARASDMTVANLYVYFDSKLQILYEIYQPWLLAQLNALRDAVGRSRSPRTKLRRTFLGLWDDIPKADHAFANSLVEALASAPQGMGKPAGMVEWAKAFLTALIQDCLPPDRRHIADGHLLAHVVWMAFDGFVISRRSGDVRGIPAMADMMTDLLLGPQRAARRRP